MILVAQGRRGADWSRISTECAKGGSAHVAGHAKQAAKEPTIALDIHPNRFDPTRLEMQWFAQQSIFLPPCAMPGDDIFLQ
jgi:hypothetical protein